MHAWALGLMSLHPTASASLSGGSAVLQQLRADYLLYSPGGTKDHVSHKRARWRQLANMIAYITRGPDVVME